MADDLTSVIDALAADAAKICGADNVSIDESERAFLSSDLYQSGDIAELVAAPGSVDEVAALVKAARAAGFAVYVRGGGRSYSNAFLPAKPGALLLDMRRLNAIRTMNADDLFVVVESGCTWKALDEALQPHGLRAAFWGPASGASATVGGSLSQGTANNNSAAVGTSSDNVLSLELVDGAGDILTTGLDAQANRLPSFRPYGPDLTGVFCADAGALGVKTAASLKLEPRPAAEGGVSFAFDRYDKLEAGLKAAAHLGLACSIVAMDAETAGVRSGETGLAADIQKLLTIIRTAHNPLRGVVRGVKIALAGRRVFETAVYTAHFLADAGDEAQLAARERALRAAVAPHGDEIPSAAISMIRAQMFPDLPTTDFTGRRLLPIHAIVAWSQIGDLHRAYTALVKSKTDALAAHDVTIAEVFSVIGRAGVLFEPVFYWKDLRTEFHDRTRPDVLGALDETYDDNPEGRALVEALKTDIINLMADHGAAHMQIGKLYPYMRDRSETNADFLRTLKRSLDPDNIINPGALGFGLEAAEL